MLPDTIILSVILITPATSNTTILFGLLTASLKEPGPELFKLVT